MSSVFFSFSGKNYEIEGLTDKDILIQRYKKNKTFYELDLLTAINKLNLSGVYVDIGANIGNHSIFFLNHCDASKVIAIEAHQQLSEILKRNLSHNTTKPYQITHGAVMDKCGYVNLTDLNPTNAGSVQVTEFCEYGIPAFTLDYYFALNPLTDKICLIKMDIEGCESLALRGAKRTIEKYRPYIVAELGSKENFSNFSQEIKVHNYRCIGKYANTPTYLWEPCQRISFCFDPSIIMPEDPGTPSLRDYEISHSEKFMICSLCKPKIIAEIGVRCGYSAHTFLQACPDAKYYGFDANNGQHGGQGGEKGKFKNWALNILSNYNIKYHELDTQKVKELPIEDPVDFFHVDGDHTFQGVIHDLNLALKYTRPGGYILIDDIDYIPEVNKSAQEFLKNNTNIESIYFESFRGDILFRKK